MATEPEQLTTLGDFLLNAPLYQKVLLDDDLKDLSALTGRKPDGGALNSYGPDDPRRFDGFCPYCKKDTTFTITTSMSIPSGDPWNNVRTRFGHDDVAITCGRSDYHRLRFWLRLQRMVLEKVGQYPSLHDIAVNEVRSKYKTVLKGENWSEFYKAVGLAAHGEGIGSFVYLRRILERLVRSRFDDFKELEGWTDEEFSRRRMVEKIEYIGKHLPAHLVSNRRIYSIFSLGLHQLDNDVCLSFFEVGKRSIIMILQDDLRHREELEARTELASAIAAFDPVVSKEPLSEEGD